MNKPLSAISAWSGLLVFLYFVLSKEFEEGLLSPCVHHIYLAIPVMAFWLTNYFKKLFSHFITILVSGLGGSSLMFLNVEWGIPIAVFLLSICFLPGLKGSPKSVLLGNIPGLIMIFVWKMWDFPEIYIPLTIIFWVILFFLSRIFFKTTPPETIIINTYSRKESIFILISAAVLSVVLLVWLSLPFYHSVYTTPGWISGILSFWLIFWQLDKRNSRFTHQSVLLTLFLSLFFQTVFLGLFSRSAGITHALLFIGFMSLTGIVVFCLMKVMDQYFGKQKSRSIFQSKKLWLNTTFLMLIFLIVDIPACSYWYHSIVNVYLPENLYPLSLGQYFLKNVAVLPALSTLLVGILFLKRRSYFP